MLEQKIEKLIEEAFNNDNPQRYIYHYSAIKFSEIKNREMLGLKAPPEVSDPKAYNKTFSAMMAPISPEWIRRFRANGFEAWGNGPLYEYKIDILKNRSAFVLPIKITSIPEENREFRKGVWANFVKTKGLDFRRLESDDKYWESIKDDYYKLVKEYYTDLKDKFVRAHYGYLTPESYVTSPKIKKIIDNWDRWLEKNLRYGKKTQYASFIPHIHTEIRKPIVPESITKII